MSATSLSFKCECILLHDQCVESFCEDAEEPVPSSQTAEDEGHVDDCVSLNVLFTMNNIVIKNLVKCRLQCPQSVTSVLMGVWRNQSKVWSSEIIPVIYLMTESGNKHMQNKWPNTNFLPPAAADKTYA